MRVFIALNEITMPATFMFKCKHRFFYKNKKQNSAAATTRT